MTRIYNNFKKIAAVLSVIGITFAFLAFSGCNAQWYDKFFDSDADTESDILDPADYIEYNYEDITGVSFLSSASYIQGCCSFDLGYNDEKLLMSARYYSKSNDYNNEISFEDIPVQKQVLNRFIESAQDMELIESIKAEIKRSKMENDGFFAYDATTYSVCIYFESGITLSYDGVGNNFSELTKCLSELADSVK